jgi:hypothetical protein
VTKSAAFYITAAMFLFVAEFCCCFGHFARQRRIFTFISGIIFIISGEANITTSFYAMLSKYTGVMYPAAYATVWAHEANKLPTSF